jgi:hypothetical protein
MASDSHLARLLSQAAAGMNDPAERKAFLDRECGRD